MTLKTWLVTLGAIELLIEAYDAEEAKQAYIEMLGIESADHDYVTVVEQVS